ncbi:MAG TPA: hypothetical protein VK473_09695 [Terriglobales bacterium]|nr:hypothetical protein [Terriglobales bacterium]
MQLRFTLEERKLLAEILEELDFALRNASSSQTGDQDPLRARQMLVEDLLDQVIDAKFEFGCDELDALVEILGDHNRKLGDELRSAGNGSAQELQRRRSLLRAILDKVIEACAMA